MSLTLTSTQDLRAGQQVPVYEFDASRSRYKYAADDLLAGLRRPNLLGTLILSNFMVRYQSMLKGAFWIVCVTSMTVAGLALVYSQVFGAALNDYFPYVAIGIVTWGLISGMVNDGAGVFVAGSAVFNETPIPKSLFALRMVGFSALSFGFKLVVVVVVLIFTNRIPGPLPVLQAVIGLALLLWTGFWFSLIAGTLGARFRDVLQMTNAALTFAFFVTPVFWQAERLGQYAFLVSLNPLHHYLNVIRGPLLGLSGVGESFWWVGGCALAVTVLGVLFYGYFARRLCYWC